MFIAMLGSMADLALGAPLTTLEYKIVGTQLRVSPAVLSVPKGIAGSVAIDVTAGEGGTNAVADLIKGTHIEATFRGPSFPARRLVGKANEPLLFPPLNLVGDYQLDDIKLVDSATGDIRLESVPRSVPVHVFDEVLVSRVTSRPLTLEEIKEKGIVIDELNFRVVEFEVVFALKGNKFPVRFPVVSPQFRDPTEIIPAAELAERLAEAERINRQLADAVDLPRELQTAALNIQVSPINFEDAGAGEGDDLKGPPPIAAIMVIPGNIGFLNQFFSVQIYTENAAPNGSGLSVLNVQGEMVLPLGNDRVAGTFETPGDDPLRFARVGPNKTIQPIQSIVQPGADSRLGTADDIARLQPGETGQAEFLVEGLREGLHVMDLKLTGDLEGLAAGTVKVKGKAAGSVLVRNPQFSLAFSHPRTVRFGEPYEANVTILNTSETTANLLSVNLSRNSLSGAVFEPGQAERVELGNLAPGQSATATYRLRSQRTGTVLFSNLTTSEDSVKGSFNLTMGVDERGVALSPDSIGMPDYVNDLPKDLMNAAHRVLGQALSVATAGRLPAGVKPVTRAIVTQRVLDLAEAGQRIRYGDAPPRVLADVLLDWQGARRFNDGFDQILRETDAGREFREALMAALEIAGGSNGLSRLMERAADFAGRGEAWTMASANSGAFDLSLKAGGAAAAAVSLDRSSQAQAAGYRGSNGHWIVATPSAGAVFEWRVSQTPAQGQIGLLVVETNGAAQQWEWDVGSPNVGTVYRYAAGTGAPGRLEVDRDGDGMAESFVDAVPAAIRENPPRSHHRDAGYQRAGRAAFSAMSDCPLSELRDGAGGALLQTNAPGGCQ